MNHKLRCTEISLYFLEHINSYFRLPTYWANRKLNLSFLQFLQPAASHTKLCPSPRLLHKAKVFQWWAPEGSLILRHQSTRSEGCLLPCSQLCLSLFYLLLLYQTGDIGVSVRLLMDMTAKRYHVAVLSLGSCCLPGYMSRKQGKGVLCFQTPRSLCSSHIVSQARGSLVSETCLYSFLVPADSFSTFEFSFFTLLPKSGSSI